MYNPRMWYWRVGGNQAQVFSSASGTYVPVTDPAYAEWLSHSQPTNISSEQELIDVLAAAAPEVVPQMPAGLVAYAWRMLESHAGGGVTVNVAASGTPIPVFCSTDQASLAGLSSLFLLAQQNASLSIPWVNGADVIYLTSAQVVVMMPLVATFVQQCFATLSTVLSGIAAGTITSAAQIVSAAWPANS